MAEKKVARWESRGGKYWIDLYFNPTFKLADGSTVIDAHYRGQGCGGGIPCTSKEDAIKAMQQMVDKGYFQADANKTPMKRVEKL